VIISHQHKFVFIKTRKTAGSTIEMVLRPWAGDDAVVTPLLPAPPGLGDPMGRNCRGVFNPIPEMKRTWRETGGGLRVRGRGIFAPLVKLRQRRAYFEHMSLELVRQRAGCSIDGYFTFCFERNPWDKALSAWLWFNRERPDLDLRAFEQWLLDPNTKGLFSEWFMYTVDDEVAVDFVGRFETLEDDLRSVLGHVGIDPRGLDLPHEKRTTRPPSSAISTAASERVAQVFHREIKEFGYDLPCQFRP